MSYTSRYKFEDFHNGFTITSDKRCKTSVIMNGGYVPTFKVVVEADMPYTRNDFCLIEFRNILKEVSKGLFYNWVSPKNGKTKKRMWMLNKCMQALSGRAYTRWQNLLSKCDKKVVDIQRKVFSIFGKCIPQLSYVSLYTLPYFSDDIIKFRSAAATCMFVNFNWEAKFNGFITNDYRNIINLQPQDWMKFYSIEEKVYPALGKTLTDFPGRMPVFFLPRLRYFHLKRPLTSRLELITNLVFADRNGHGERLNTMINFNCFHFADEVDIRKAIRKVDEHLRQKTNLGKFVEVMRTLHYIMDFPDVHNGGLPGLAEKSIKWHRDNRRVNMDVELNRYKLDREMKTAVPPIELPKVKNVKFLANVGEILEEGRDMNHCIGSYAQRAIRGYCYLFHVDYDGWSATVEVSPQGYVTQSRGPKNCINEATKYGERVLKQWGKKLQNNSAGFIKENVFEGCELPF